MAWSILHKMEPIHDTAWMNKNLRLDSTEPSRKPSATAPQKLK